MTTHDLIVIGGGPAGLAAAIFAAQHGVKALLIECGPYGGQILGNDAVENWPGDLRVRGSELSERFRRQAEQSGVVLVAGRITCAELARPVKLLTTADGQTLHARAVILCPGAQRAEEVKIPQTAFLVGSGVALASDGAVLTDPETLATNLPGVFAAGDCRRKWLKKLITAVADGAIAAAAATEYLNGQ